MKTPLQRQLYAATFSLDMGIFRDCYSQTILFYAENESKVYEYIREKYLLGQLELDDIRAESKYLRFNSITLQNPSYNPHDGARLEFYDEPVELTIQPYILDAITL